MPLSRRYDARQPTRRLPIRLALRGQRASRFACRLRPAALLAASFLTPPVVFFAVARRALVGSLTSAAAVVMAGPEPFGFAASRRDAFSSAAASDACFATALL